MISKQDTQMLKGVAILMVITQHLGQTLHISLLNPLGSIGVCLFLFVSGYGLSCSYDNNGRNNYFFKRILKVYTPYLVSVILFCVWLYCIGNAPTSRMIFDYLLLIDFPQGSFWYLQLLFFWYAVFFFLTFLFEHKWTLIITLCVASIAITAYQEFNRLYVWQIASFPAGVIYFKNRKCISKVRQPVCGGGSFSLLPCLWLF